MAIRSAQLYYDYLDRNGKGIVKISVRKITPETAEDGVLFHLHLSARLSDAAAQALGDVGCRVVVKLAGEHLFQFGHLSGPI